MQTIPHKKVRDAVNNIIQNHAFYATILMQQNIIEDNSRNNPTFYVDGKNLAYNSKFADSLSFDEVKGVLAHEVMHLVLLHHARMGKRDARIYNIAADHVINNQLIKDGFILPKGLYNDPKFAGMNVEEVYRILYLEEVKKQAEQDKQNQDKQDNNSGESSDSMPGAGDNDEDSDSDNSDEKDSSEDSNNQEDTKENEDDAGDNSGDESDNEEGNEENSESANSNDEEGGEEEKPVTFGEIRPATEDNAEEKAKIQSKQAISIAKAAGEMPGGSIIEMIENSYKPKFNWREIINQFVSEITQKDYSFENPDRRFLQNGIILPDFYSKAPANIVVAIDTSGSVNIEEVKAIVNEARSCLDMMSEDKENATLTVIYCDARVQSVDIFEAGSDIKPNPKGGGGTDYAPVFKYIRDNDVKCDGLIYITDGYCWTFGDIIPDYRVFWGLTVSYNDFRPPFGEKFVFDIHGE